MTGVLYGVGVGPGDPELMTLKAVRLIRETEMIALPGSAARETVAYQIAVQAVPELAQKTLLPVSMPMVMNREEMKRNHRKAADLLESRLIQGQNVVYLTLGDSTIYSTFLYIQRYITERGYRTELVNGVPSFCAAAARTGISLAEWNEPLHILPAAHHVRSEAPAPQHPAPMHAPDTAHHLPDNPPVPQHPAPMYAPDTAHHVRKPFDLPGNYILMKSGHRMDEVKTLLRESGLDVVMVENCGMPEEKIYHGADEIPDDAGYYSLIIAKKPQSEEPDSF
ncbi:MAG: precorrin-2 C(20)-methyltransferase [Lachnospiraceae bacterium]|nr:precorrin-2 C(20)-methyltransferase [Lachnospiraceae bacterium]